MLEQIKVKNYILIRDLDTTFHPKLNTLTGETGAGKSIVLGALGLLLGNRADPSALLDPENKCIIEGHFRVDQLDLKSFFEDHELDFDESCIIRREILSSGKSRAFVNDTPVTLNILKELGEYLVDIHSQHQTLKVINPNFQLSILDSFAGNNAHLAHYREVFADFSRKSSRLKKLRDLESQAKREYDFNHFQYDELSKAKLLENELGALEKESEILSNAELIQQTLAEVSFSTYEDESSIYNQLTGIRKSLSGLIHFNIKFEGLANRIQSMLIEAKDIYADLNQISDGISTDNDKLKQVNERIGLINSLMSKHQFREYEELISYRKSLSKKLKIAENQSEELTQLEAELNQIKQRLKSIALDLHNMRQNCREGLERKIIALLALVGINDARIEFRITQTNQFSSTGIDKVEIYFSANKGIKLEPIGNAASGGELSRLMLCLKAILSEGNPRGLIVFDEIDTGISGEVAIKVGRIIRELSQNTQVICITHLPQVAAMGYEQYQVFKDSVGEKTETNIRHLNRKARIDEIATMIGGSNASDTVRKNAEELLISYAS